MDILLHICCAPCAIYPLHRLKDQGFKISGFYYNPNIYPLVEYIRRREALDNLRQEFYLDVEYPAYQEADFYQAIGDCLLGALRCRSCWSLRLEKTALWAKSNGIKAFSTTLLASPYQDHGLLKQIGEQIGRKIGVDFYYEDFRIGFKQAQNVAKEKGIYRQKYCGCKYSMRRLTKAIKKTEILELSKDK